MSTRAKPRFADALVFAIAPSRERGDRPRVGTAAMKLGVVARVAGATRRDRTFGRSR